MNTCISLKAIVGLAVESGAHLRKDKSEKIQFVLTSGEKRSSTEKPASGRLWDCPAFLFSGSKYKSVTNSPNSVATQL